MRVATIIAALGLWAGIAGAASTSFLFVPTSGTPATLRSNVAGSANVMECVRFRPPVGITGATKAAFVQGASTGSGTVGFAIYSVDGDTRLASATGTLGTANTVITMTGISSFSLVADTDYWVCLCSANGTGSTRGQEFTETIFVGIMNDTQVRAGTAANACSSGSPPATMGTVSAASVSMTVFQLATDTP